MKEISNDMKLKYSKIENWYKHKRRTDVMEGKMKFEVYFFQIQNSLLKISKK